MNKILTIILSGLVSILILGCNDTLDYDNQNYLKIGIKVDQEAKKLGMVDLEKYVDNLVVKNFSYAHPAFIYMFRKLDSKNYNAHRITEGWPVTVRHKSKAHFNGRAIDVTVRRPSQAEEICNYINSLKDFRCINEYKKKFSTTTGKHLHLAYKGK